MQFYVETFISVGVTFPEFCPKQNVWHRTLNAFVKVPHPHHAPFITFSGSNLLLATVLTAAALHRSSSSTFFSAVLISFRWTDELCAVDGIAYGTFDLFQRSVSHVRSDETKRKIKQCRLK